MMGRDYWKDNQEDLFFIRHDIVLNDSTPDEIEKRLREICADPYQSEIVELMMHEQHFYPELPHYYESDFRERIERALEFVTERGYRSVFYDEGFLGASVEN